jgi:hypothetical protein
MVIGRKHPETNKERDQACPAGFIASSWTRKKTGGVCPDGEEREEKRVKGSFNALKDPFSPGREKGTSIGGKARVWLVVSRGLSKA